MEELPLGYNNVEWTSNLAIWDADYPIFYANWCLQTCEGYILD